MRRGRPARLWTAVVMAATSLIPVPLAACTTFCLRGAGSGPVVGKNYDWAVGRGLLVVNPRGLAKTAHLEDDDRPMRWTARFGSVTFDQYGREFPAGGINEAGLVVELMWLDGTRYPAPDERGALGTLQWIQFQLDTAATVGEVIASHARVRIRSQHPLHYLVADPSGKVATIEFLGGELVAHTGGDLPDPVLANSTYETSARYLARLRREGRGAAPGWSSLDRHARAAERLRQFSPEEGEAVSYAFATLAAVAQPTTQWSIVYELAERRLHFRTRGRPAIRSLDLDDLDFSCARPAQMLDLAREVEGDLRAALEPYSTAANEKVIRAGYRGVDFLAATPDRILAAITGYPETLTCAEP